MYKLLGAAVALSLATVAWADEASDKLDNPKPLADDVSLPLPCEGNMVFRYAYVLAQGTLDDREISLGYPFAEGEAEQRNFHMYEVMKLADAPHRIATVIVDSNGPLGGVGEPGLPCAAPALANALAAATGKRARQLPLAKAYAA